MERVLARENIRGALHHAFKWDVFISYRVDADANVVKELYWQLVSTEVTVDGKTRKLNVFWDKKCLKDGASCIVGPFLGRSYSGSYQIS